MSQFYHDVTAPMAAESHWYKAGTVARFNKSALFGVCQARGGPLKLAIPTQINHLSGGCLAGFFFLVRPRM